MAPSNVTHINARCFGRGSLVSPISYELPLITITAMILLLLMIPSGTSLPQALDKPTLPYLLPFATGAATRTSSTRLETPRLAPGTQSASSLPQPIPVVEIGAAARHSIRPCWSATREINDRSHTLESRASPDPLPRTTVKQLRLVTP